MELKEKIFSTVAENGIILSPDDVERLNHSIKTFEKMIRDVSEKNWYERNHISYCEYEEPEAVAFIKEDLIPGYEAKFPETAAALQYILDIEPHFLINGGISEKTWRQIRINYGKETTDETTYAIESVINTYDMIIERERDAYIDECTETFFNNHAEMIIEAALGDVLCGEEDTQTV